MPPVFGIVRPDLLIPDRNQIRRMTDAAAYRVPGQLVNRDLTGIWAAAVGNSHGKNEETGVFCVRGNHLIVADASLYNHNELLYRLGLDPKAGNPADAELILRAYEKWGEECLKYLYGDFAFIIFNMQSGNIFCGRDPMGVRPFFYSLRQNTFMFSSELRIISAAEDKKPEPDIDFLLDSLAGVKSSKDRSPFKNIFRLPPAHYLICKNGEIQTTRYWMPDDQATIKLASEEEYIAMFRELMVNAVNMRCNGVTALGAELSGGLDSSAIAGIAADLASSENIPLTAFSNVFPEDTGIGFTDEREFIRDMIAYKKLKGVNIEKIGIPIDKLLHNSLGVQGTFIQQNFNVFNYGLFKAAGDAEINVLLSGFGGDELVSARVSIPWNELIGDRQWKVIRDEIFYRGITPRSLLKPGLIAARYMYSRFHHPQYRTGVFTPELLDKRLTNLPLKPSYVEKHHLSERFRDKYKTPYRDKLSSRQLYRVSMDHLPQRMEYCYSAAAQFGIEYRYPLLDVNLMLACLAFPPWIKQHHGNNRYLFRQAIKGFVPESIRQRNDKSGSTIPHTYYSLIQEKDQILGLIRDCSSVPALNEIFDFSRFPSWYEKLVQRDKRDINYLNPGLFYTYLMMMLYFKEG